MTTNRELADRLEQDMLIGRRDNFTAVRTALLEETIAALRAGQPSPPRAANKAGKVQMTIDDLKNWATLSMSNGTERAAFEMYEQWCAQANAELAKWMNGALVLEADKRSLAEELAQVKKELDEEERQHQETMSTVAGFLARTEKAEQERDRWEYLARIAEPEYLAMKARAEKAEQFREAVIDALVVSCIYVEEHDTNPRKAINDLICWEQKIALDPAVSNDARALIERAVAGCAEDCAIQVAAREKSEQENARLREALGARLFIDCEWNDYLGDLISMALVGEDGREWYEVLECRDPSSWVAENVMPKLGKQPTTMEHMRKSLCEFLSVYKAVTIIADWPEDIERFCRFLVIGPGLRLDTPDLRFHVWRGLEGESAKPHNALEDARANARTALGGEE